MPFNTWLEVTNLQNSETVNVRVIDRGPFVGGRIIDLSKAAARDRSDLLRPGVGTGSTGSDRRAADVPANDFYAVQAGAFAIARMPSSARTVCATLRQRPDWHEASAHSAYGGAGGERTARLKRRSSSLIVLGAENKSVFVVRLDETVYPAQAESK